MDSVSTGSNCCTSLMFLIIGFAQIVVYLTTAVVASMVAEGFRPFTVTEVEYSYTTWYCLSVLVSTISAAHCLLAVVFTWANIKHSCHGLLVWLCCMWSTCVVQALTMLAILVEILLTHDTSSELGLAVPTVELDRWRISLTARPVTSVTYQLIDCFGEWILGFGIFWCCVLCINCCYIYLTQAAIECENFKLENHNNDTDIDHDSQRNDVEAQTGEGRIRGLPSNQHIQLQDVIAAIEYKNRNSLYPFADLRNALATEEASSRFASAPPLEE